MSSLPPKVKVKQGTVVGGERKLPNGNSYYYFKGIPYAVPPLGKLRFQAPVPLESFATSEIDCTNERDVSFQKDPFQGIAVGSENCLFLNVYTPRSRTDDQLPVMIYIHGGGFVVGSGNGDFYTPLYLMQEDVVVVTFNYRLGALGFLSMPEANIPGNAGLKDQRLVLQWVKENISQFGGNPGNITLFGESVGAACVHLHTMSHTSKKLFHRAIMQSGGANMPWAMQENASYKAKKLAELMGCTSEDPLEIGNFLTTHPELIDFQIYGPAVLTPDEIRRGLPMSFRPVVEAESADALVTEEPLKSMSKPNSIEIPIMMGYNSGEGNVMVKRKMKKLKDVDQDLRIAIPRNINLRMDDPRSLDLANRIRAFYFKGGKVDSNSLDNLSELLGDFHFTIDAYVAAEIHSRQQHISPLYFYRFDYVGGLNMFKKLLNLEHMKGANHADELFYLLQSNMAPEPWDDRDRKFVQTICKLWANFAKYGNPTPTPQKEETFVDCSWHPVPKLKGNEVFVLDAFEIAEKQNMVRNPEGERVGFWRSVYREYNGTASSKL